MSAVASPQEAQKFVEKWERSDLSERAASHEHFIDLCRLVGQPAPAEADPTGEDYCFEKPVKVVAAASKGSKGEGGFVDVWKRGFFAWEYKRKDKYKNLDEAYRQLYQYRDLLDDPPLSVVWDIRTIEIRTHFGLFDRQDGRDAGRIAGHLKLSATTKDANLSRHCIICQSPGQSPFATNEQTHRPTINSSVVQIGPHDWEPNTTQSPRFIF